MSHKFHINDELKNFYRTVFLLVLPMAIQNLINVAVQSADVIMLGRLPHSEVVLSASSLAGQVYFIMNLILFGLTSGASVLMAQYWGKQDQESFRTIWGLTMRPALFLSLIFTGAAILFARPIMAFLSSEEAVIDQGVPYLQIVCIAYIFMAFTMVYLNVMRCMERVVVSAVVYSISLIINIVLNYLFIFGHMGFPAMGIRGAALATVIARISEFVMVLIYNQYINNAIRFDIRILGLSSKLLQKDLITFAIPVILNEMFWGMGMSANAAILGNLGSAVSSASAIVQVTRQLSMVVGFGVSGATAILVGKTIGEQNMTMAKTYGKRFFQLSIYSGMLAMIVISITRPILLAAMNLSDDARHYLGFMLLLMIPYSLFQAINTICVVGIFRAGGDTRFGLYLDMIGLWGVSIIPSFLCAFVFHLDTHIVYTVMMLDEFAKVPFVVKRFRSYKWLKDVTR